MSIIEQIIGPKMKEEMFKNLQDFINDIKGQGGDVPSIEGANDQEYFFEDDGCPSQPVREDEKPILFDELGGIPAPEFDDWDEEEGDEPSNKRRHNIFARLLQTYGCPWRPDDETDEDY